MEVMELITSSFLIAGIVPVEAITLAPSAPVTKFMKSRAASLCLDFWLTAREVIVPRVVPASTPSGCGYFTMPHSFDWDSPLFTFSIWVAMNQLPMFIIATELL
ncbi:hypothetical protein D3C81_2051050 [compost metagenome]